MKDFGMPGLGDDSVHRSYDDVATELRQAVSRLAAPVALAARNRRLHAERELRLQHDQLARLQDRHTRAPALVRRTQAPSPEYSPLSSAYRD